MVVCPIGYAKPLVKVKSRPIVPKPRELAYYKVVVFVPCDSFDAVRNAMAKAGAGRLGNYQACSFAAKGRGDFEALEGADPFSWRSREIDDC